MVSIGETISRVRNSLKGAKEDAFLTDRFIYSVILKYSKLLVKRQDNENKIMRFQSLFEVLPCVDLVEVDKVEACCGNIKSKCTIMRTREKIPQVMEGAYGPLFRDITSIDGSIVLYRTYPSMYVHMTNTTNFKYNTTKYYWYQDGHLFFPNLMWDAVRIEAIWDDNIEYLKCGSTEDRCKIRQEQDTNVPDYLFAEIEQFVLRDLGVLAQIPQDNKDDAQNLLR